MLNHFMSENLILIKRNLKNIEGIMASVQDKIYINDISIAIEEGDIFQHTNSAGFKNTLMVLNVIYHNHPRMGHIEINYEKVKLLPKIYLDTNIVSRINDLRVKDVDITALCTIAEKYNLGEVQFFTSKKTLDEIQKIEDSKKKGMISFFYHLIVNIPTANLVDHVSGGLGSAPFGAAPLGGGYSRENPLFKKLKTLFDPDDAEHILHAEKSNIEFFLTLDKETILDRVKNEKEKFDNIGLKIKITSPQELVSMLQNYEN